MFRHLSLIIKLVLLGVMVFLTLSNLALTYDNCAAEGSDMCYRFAERMCRSICRDHGGCEDAFFLQGWCMYSICWQEWFIACEDGYYEEHEFTCPDIPCPY